MTMRDLWERCGVSEVFENIRIIISPKKKTIISESTLIFNRKTQEMISKVLSRKSIGKDYTF
jgi:hypothetical protein